MKPWQFLIFFGIYALTSSCKWNPHYLDNDAVFEESRLYSPDSSTFILSYDLDLGARGSRMYRSVVKVGEEHKCLIDHFIPWELQNLKWIDNSSVEVTFDSLAKFNYGETTHGIDLTMDTILINHVRFIVTKRIDYPKVKQELVQIETKYGNIVLFLHPETPIHKEAFLNLVKEGYFNGQQFNRVIDGFVIQGGMPDPTDYSKGGLWEDTSMFIPPEFHKDLKHRPGALGGGRDNNPKMMTNPYQFYIVDSTDRDLSRLDMKYTIFGQVVMGMDVVQKISEVQTNDKDEPLDPIFLKTVILQPLENE